MMFLFAGHCVACSEWSFQICVEQSKRHVCDKRQAVDHRESCFCLSLVPYRAFGSGRDGNISRSCIYGSFRQRCLEVTGEGKIEEKMSNVNLNLQISLQLLSFCTAFELTLSYCHVFCSLKESSSRPLRLFSWSWRRSQTSTPDQSLSPFHHTWYRAARWLVWLWAVCLTFPSVLYR